MLLVGDWAPEGKRVNLPEGTSLMLGNLEGPVLPPTHSIPAAAKAGPSMFSTDVPRNRPGVVFALANNHLMDYGQNGLLATLDALVSERIAFCGAGKDLASARRPIVVSDRGSRVGIISCCETQFGVARDDAGGVAAFGPWLYKAIGDLREQTDAVVVSAHAALEDAPWPSPFIQEFYRSLIDAGAAVVHGHHAHMPQGCEEYRDGLILYGLGNFAVDPDKWGSYANGLWSLGARVDFGVKPFKWEIVGFEIQPDGTDSISITRFNTFTDHTRRRYLESCNMPLAHSRRLAALWQEIALRAYSSYGAAYMQFRQSGSSGRSANVRDGLTLLKNALFNENTRSANPLRSDYLLWYHMIACESHREMLRTALGILGGEIEDLRTDEARRLVDEMMPWSTEASRA